MHCIEEKSNVLIFHIGSNLIIYPILLKFSFSH